MRAPRLMPAGAVAAAAALLVGLVDTGAAQAPAELTFCVGANSQPDSQLGIPAEVDVHIARALANEIGAAVRLVRLDPHDAGPEQAVLADRCQAALGVIDDPFLLTRDRSPGGIELTDPYNAAGYALISRGDVRPVRTLAELGESRIGVEKESIVAFTLRQRGRRVHVLSDAGAVVRAVAERRLDFGYLWGPLAARQIRGRPEVVLVKQFVPADRWNISIAVRRDTGELRRRLNRAIHDLLQRGGLARILAADDTPFLVPGAGGRIGGRVP